MCCVSLLEVNVLPPPGKEVNGCVGRNKVKLFCKIVEVHSPFSASLRHFCKMATKWLLAFVENTLLISDCNLKLDVDKFTKNVSNII